MDVTSVFRRTVSLGLLVSTAACYTERPLSTPAPVPETRIVATITDVGAATMATEIGSGAVGLEGVIEAVDAESWSLRLLRVEHRDGRFVSWNRESVRFPSTALENVTERKLDRPRSWLTGGLIAGAAILAARAFQMIGADTNSGTDPVPAQ